MNKNFYLSLFFFIHFSFCAFGIGVVDSLGNPTAPVLQLLKETNVRIRDFTLESIVETTQKVWLRPVDKERFQLNDHSEEPTKQRIMASISEIGCLEEKHGSIIYYDCIVVLGGIYERMKKRIEFMIEEMNRGIKCNTIVYLGSSRPLDPIEEKDQLEQNMKTECDAMHYLSELYSSQIPNTIKQVLINTPMKTENNKLKRPDRADTFKAWLSTDPSIKSCLLISTQPYIGQQHAVARTYLPSQWYIETVGPAAQEGTTIPDHLDNLARWLYQERELRNHLITGKIF